MRSAAMLRIRADSSRFSVGLSPGSRLVQQQQSRPGAERAGDLQPALLAVGQAAGGDVGASHQAHPIQQRHRRGRALPVVTPSSGQPEHVAHRAGTLQRLDRDLHVFQRGQGRKQPDVLEGASDAEARDLVRLATEDRHAAAGAMEDDLAALRVVGPGQAVEQRGLAGAVGADDGEHAAAGHRQRHVVQAGQTAETQGDVRDLQDRRTHRRAGRGSLVLGQAAHELLPLMVASACPTPASERASSRLRRRDGSRPCGRNTIISMITAPK